MSDIKYSFQPDEYSGHSRIVRIVKQMSALPLRILDVGTAQGYIGHTLSAVGHRMFGIEYDPNWAAIAQPNYCEPIQLGDLDTMEPRFADQSFDLIILGAILEHLKYPEAVLRRLTRCLKPDGKIVVSMPNVANWYIRLHLLLGKWDYQDRGILDRTHLRFYTWKAFQQLLADCGYRVTHREIAPIPLPQVFPLTAPGKPFYFCHMINNAITQLRGPFFGFAFVVTAERVRE